jgi:hypothetical protein
MKFVAFIIAVLVGMIACHNVVELTSSTFKSKVMESEGIWMVAFVAPWWYVHSTSG